MLILLAYYFLFTYIIKMNNDEFSGNIFQWDIYTLLNYIKINYIQFI